MKRLWREAALVLEMHARYAPTIALHDLYNRMILWRTISAQSYLKVHKIV